MRDGETASPNKQGPYCPFMSIFSRNLKANSNKHQRAAMESDKSNATPKEAIFRLFDDKPTSGLGFLDFPEKPLPPPPPCLEVLSSEVPFSAHTHLCDKDRVSCLFVDQLSEDFSG